MPGLNLKAAQWEQQHKTHVEEYLRQIEALYDVACLLYTSDAADE